MGTSKNDIKGENVRGMVFSSMLFLVIFLILIAGLTFIGTERGYGEEVSVRIRSDEMMYYVNSFVYDLERGAAIVGKKSMAILIDKVIEEGVPLNNSGEVLEIMITTGEYGNITLNESIQSWITKLISAGEYMDFNVKVSNVSVNVVPYNSWNFVIITSMELNVTDKRGLCAYHNNITSVALADIIGLEDPLFPLYTQGRLPRQIFAGPYQMEKHVVDNDTSNLTDCIVNKYYHAVEDGPSIFDRLEGNLEVSEKYKSETATYLNISVGEVKIGLETFVNVDDLIDVGLGHIVAQKINQSCIDHYYFDYEEHIGKKVIGVSDTNYTWFKIDEEHASKYGINSSLLY
jgi:hypothetical protein